jgi:hypothetical protein
VPEEVSVLREAFVRLQNTKKVGAAACHGRFGGSGTSGAVRGAGVYEAARVGSTWGWMWSALLTTDCEGPCMPVMQSSH